MIESNFVARILLKAMNEGARYRNESNPGLLIASVVFPKERSELARANLHVTVTLAGS